MIIIGKISWEENLMNYSASVLPNPNEKKLH